MATFIYQDVSNEEVVMINVKCVTKSVSLPTNQGKRLEIISRREARIKNKSCKNPSRLIVSILLDQIKNAPKDLKDIDMDLGYLELDQAVVRKTFRVTSAEAKILNKFAVRLCKAHNEPINFSLTWRVLIANYLAK
jgi:hypothetical protein